MSKKAVVVSSVAAATVLVGILAICFTWFTFYPVASGTGDAAGAGIAATSASWVMTAVGVVATVLAYFKKWQPLAQTVLDVTAKVNGGAVSPGIAKDAVDGMAAIDAIIAWKNKPDDKTLERAALMSILTLADDLIGSKYPAAQDNLNALGHTVIEAMFPASAPLQGETSTTSTSAIDAVVAAAVAKINAATPAPAV